MCKPDTPEQGAIRVLKALVRHIDLKASITRNTDVREALEWDAKLARGYASFLEKGNSLDKLVALSETFHP